MAVTIKSGEKVTLMVQYEVVDDDGSVFRDSIVMSLPDYENIWLKKTKKSGDDQKMARFNAWKAAKIAASQIVYEQEPVVE